MKASRPQLALAMTLGLLAPSARAGGSPEFSRIEHFLAEQPATYRWLRAPLQFSNATWAELRLGPPFAHLSGRRLGASSFQASRKDGTGPAGIEVILGTRQRFLDAVGRTLPPARWGSARAVEEHLDSVIVREQAMAYRIPQCS